jgi:predicted nucleic acid-binding protein
LLNRAMDLFRGRPDKEWSLADCVSFVVMSDEHLSESLSCDHHFVQAGFRALMLE